MPTGLGHPRIINPKQMFHRTQLHGGGETHEILPGTSLFDGELPDSQCIGRLLLLVTERWRTRRILTAIESSRGSHLAAAPISSKLF